MTKRRETIPIDQSGNGSKIKTLDFEEADAYMLARALSIAICTAMMSGGKESIGRMRHYKDQLSLLVPPGAKLFKHDTDISEIAYLSNRAPTWSVYKIKENSWSRRFRPVFVLGKRKFTSSNLMESQEELQPMIEVVEKLIDLNCVRVEMEDQIGNVWSV